MKSYLLTLNGKLKDTLGNLSLRMKAKIYVLLTIIFLLILFRISLSYFGLYYLNNQLNKDQNYQSHVTSLNISLWNQSVTLNGIQIELNKTPIPVPLFTANSIEISFHVIPILSGKMVADIKVAQPIFNYIMGALPIKSNLRSIPVVIHKFEVNNGEINIINFRDAPHFKISISHIHTTLNKKSGSELYLIDSKGQVMNSGNYYLHGKLNPFSKDPNFYIESAIRGLDIPEFNSVIKHYTDVTTRAGKFSIYIKLGAQNGKISGYAKPFIKNLSIIQKKDDNVIKKAYKKAVQVSAEILQNSHQKTDATKINISGTISDPDIDMLSVVLNLLQHAFIAALAPSLDDQFSSQDIVYNQSNATKTPHYNPNK